MQDRILVGKFNLVLFDYGLGFLDHVGSFVLISLLDIYPSLAVCARPLSKGA